MQKRGQGQINIKDFQIFISQKLNIDDILKIGYIIVVFFLWNAKVYITDINNIKEISAAFQEIFIFPRCKMKCNKKDMLV